MFPRNRRRFRYGTDAHSGQETNLIFKGIKRSQKTPKKAEEKRMKKKDEKPDTITAGLYITGFVICGYLIIKAILRS